MHNNKAIGRYGEQLAAEFLQRHGYEIITQNYQASYKELDIIARQGDIVVFVEVKTRTSRSFGDGTEAVEFHKQRHLRRGISSYLAREKTPHRDVRADLITVLINAQTKNVRIRHYQGIL